MLKTAKNDDGLNNNYKKSGGGTRRSREDGEGSRERVRSSRKTQKAGLRVLVNDGMESVTVDKRKKWIYAGKAQVLGDRTNKNSVDGKAKSWLGDLTPEVDASANASLGKLVRRVKKVQVPGLELKSKSQKWLSENADIEMRYFKDESEARKKFTYTLKERMARSSSVLTNKVDGKRALRGDLKSRDDEAKTRKRVIRIDAHDISNKRLDDGVVVPCVGDINVKKDSPEKIVHLSKNAQFRAIQPSPSILSFVEDNILGCKRMIDLRRAGYDTNFSAPLDNTPLLNKF